MSGHITHGLTKAPEYQVWFAMRARCSKSQSKDFKYYGERGISVCSRWSKFSNFHADMGFRPSPYHSLDRKKVNGNYTPRNCRWATLIEQANNRTNNHYITWMGQRKTLTEWSRIYTNGNYKILSKRLKRGWSFERAITEPRCTTYLIKKP